MAVLQFFQKLFGAEKATGVYTVEINSLNGKRLNLMAFKGKKILIVNVASACGLTPQYEKLQKLYSENSDKLVILGVPCNDFAGQEPGTPEEIAGFCTAMYGVTFPLTEKINILKEPVHPLYLFLTKKELNNHSDSRVEWNFQKYLVGKTGELSHVFNPNIQPDDATILQALNQ